METVNVLTIGDPHFKGDNTCDTDVLQSEVLRVIDERSVDMVVVLGDIMHDHGNAKMNVFNRACAFMEAITKKVGRGNTFMLIGNHDRVNNKVSEGDDHFFRHYKTENSSYPTVVDSVQLVSKGEHIFCLAQYMEPGKLRTMIDKQLESQEVDFLDVSTYFLHQEIKGCKMGSQVSENGDEWLLDAPLAVSGHIHEWQMPQPNVIYVGTPMQITFGCSADKSISLLTYKGGVNRPEIEKIQLNIPRKIGKTLTCTEFANYDIPEDTWIKFKIVDTSPAIVALKKSKKYKTANALSKIKFNFVDCNQSVSCEATGTGDCRQIMVNAPFQTRIMRTILGESPGVRSIFKEIDGENL